MEPVYQKRGYLTDEFRLFHLTDKEPPEFAFHYHDFDKIIVFLSGNVTYMIEGRSYELAPFDIVLVSHNEIHRPFIVGTAPYERIVIYLSPRFLASYPTDDGDLGSCFKAAREHGSHVLRMHVPGRPAFFSTIRRLEHATREAGYAKPLYCRVLFLEFLIQLNRALGSRDLGYQDTGFADLRILAVLEYINQNLSEALGIDALAARFHFSRYHLMRLFKQETGSTIARYITSKRLLAAKELLAADIPITEICYRCGFQNYSTFSRAYKAEFHESPRQTRINETNCFIL